jgi:hypothetical protein
VGFDLCLAVFFFFWVIWPNFDKEIGKFFEILVFLIFNFKKKIWVPVSDQHINRTRELNPIPILKNINFDSGFENQAWFGSSS